MTQIDRIRGGQGTWEVKIGRTFDTETNNIEIMSIEGIEQRISFDSTYSSATVIIKLFDFANIAPESGRVQIFYGDIPLWGGIIDKAVRDEKILTLTATGILSKVDDSATDYDTVARCPLDAYQMWLNVALPGNDQLTETWYSSTKYRDYMRVAPPASTLGKWPEVRSYGDFHLYGYPHIKNSDDKYIQQLVDYGTIATDEPVLTMTDFCPCPDTQYQSSASSNTLPLAFHNATSFDLFAYVGAQKHPTWGSYDDPGTADWFEGRDQYFGFSAMDFGNRSVDIHSAEVEPTGTSQIRVRDKSAAHIANNIILTILSAGGSALGWAGIGTSFHKVSAGIFDSTRIGDDSHSTSTLFHSWRPGVTPPSWVTNDNIKWTFDFTDALFGKADISDKSTNFGATANLSYKHPYILNSGLHGVDGNCTQYKLKQTVNVCSIDQTPWAKDLALEAGFLAGACAYEGYVSDGHSYNYAAVAELYPESGSVFQIPLDVYNSTRLQWQADNPVPATYTCTYRSSIGEDGKITSEKLDEYAPVGANEKTLSILQGFIPTDAKSPALGHYYYEIKSKSWNAAGVLADRFSGIYYDNSHSKIARMPFDSSWQEAFDDIDSPHSGWSRAALCFLQPDGTLQKCLGTPMGPGQQGDTFEEGQYFVTDKDGNTRYLFGQGATLAIGTPKKKSLDFSPVMSMLKASSRVYSLPARPTYTCEASMAFASVQPGMVVLIKQPIFDNWLGLVISKRLETTSSGVDLTIAPMHPVTENDLAVWDNLSAILGALNYELPPEPLGERLIFRDRCPGTGFVGQSWWYPYTEYDTDKEFQMVAGDEVTIIVENLITKERKTYTSSSWIWDTEYHNHSLNFDIRDSIGDYNGNVRIQIDDASPEARFVFNTETLPNLVNYVFYLDYIPNNNHGWTVTSGTELNQVVNARSPYKGATTLGYKSSGGTTIYYANFDDPDKGCLVQIGQYSARTYASFMASEADILTPEHGFENVTGASTTPVRTFACEAMGVWFMSTGVTNNYRMFINDNNAMWIQSATIRIWVDVEAEWR